MAQNSQAVIPDNIIIVDGELNPVPTPEAGDSGKVLTVVNEDGTIGWSPVSSSGTQLQADWSVTDDTSVQYIAHKPDLSVYATSSDVTTALAGKQDTISDLSDIRAGAALGATSVQPADLSDYVEASSLAAVATSGSYNDLTNKPTIPSGDDLVPSATSADEGKVLTVDSQGDPAWVTPSVGPTYTAGTGIDISAQNAISIDTTTVATKSDLPSSSDLVPSSSSGDAGKVLTVDSQGEPSWVTPSGGTTYSAGDGIAIDSNNVVSADVDGTTIGIDSTTKKIKLLSTIPTVDQTYNASSTNAQSGTAVASAVSNAVSGLDEVPAVTSSDNGKVLKATYSGGAGSYAWATESGSDDVFVAEYGVTSWADINAAFLANKALFAYYNGHTYVMSDMVYSGGLKSVTFANVRSDERSSDNTGISVWFVKAQSTGTTWSFPDHSAGYLVNPPDDGDEGKVLTAKNPLTTGSNFEWATPSGGTTYTAGNMINISNQNAIGVSTTAGITDIQKVNSLPANPVSTVLYLIPET